MKEDNYLNGIEAFVLAVCTLRVREVFSHRLGMRQCKDETHVG